MRIYYLCISLTNIYWTTTVHKILECKGKENMHLFPEDLTIFRETDTKGPLVCCSKDYDRESHNFMGTKGMFVHLNIRVKFHRGHDASSESPGFQQSIGNNS